ncbi:ABC transporter permease [Halopiger goleimassiliensis]|uniref:ABC transporter permease n=1 Tax=Halopiger goleimassiliensis TaxID=1293048 RepID=UPI000677741F|nr:ABC transporter permease [Halopiger goleimassiliensis]
MDLLALLRKETIAARRNLALIVVVLVVLPAAIIGGTVVFQTTIPQDVPVGVTGTDDATANDIAIARAGVTTLATPIGYESTDDARAALAREDVYLVVEVPGDVTDPDANATVTVISDGAYVPLEEPVDESAALIERQFDAALPADIHVEQERLGTDRTLSAFLVPTGAFAFVVLYALVFLPYQVRSERRVVDRLRTETRLETVLASKLLFYGGALAVPTAIVALATRRLGYDVAAAAPLSLLSLGLTFVFLSAVGLAICFAFDLRTSGLFVDLGIAVGVFAFSSLVFPAGFFSTIQGTIARMLPTYYAAVATRSGMLRDVPLTLYGDHLLWLGGTTLASLVALELALIRYRRRR